MSYAIVKGNNATSVNATISVHVVSCKSVLLFIFLALDDHEKNPSNKWGRFSSPSSGLVHNFSNPPENELVYVLLEIV